MCSQPCSTKKATSSSLSRVSCTQPGDAVGGGTAGRRSVSSRCRSTSCTLSFESASPFSLAWSASLSSPAASSRSSSKMFFAATSFPRTIPVSDPPGC